MFAVCVCVCLAHYGQIKKLNFLPETRRFCVFFRTKVRFCCRIGALVLFWLRAVTLVPLQSVFFLQFSLQLNVFVPFCVFKESRCFSRVFWPLTPDFCGCLWRSCFLRCDSTCTFKSLFQIWSWMFPDLFIFISPCLIWFYTKIKLEVFFFLFSETNVRTEAFISPLMIFVWFLICFYRLNLNCVKINSDFLLKLADFSAYFS